MSCVKKKVLALQVQIEGLALARLPHKKIAWPGSQNDDHQGLLLPFRLPCGFLTPFPVNTLIVPVLGLVSQALCLEFYVFWGLLSRTEATVELAAFDAAETCAAVWCGGLWTFVKQRAASKIGRRAKH